MTKPWMKLILSNEKLKTKQEQMSPLNERRLQERLVNVPEFCSFQDKKLEMKFSREKQRTGLLFRAGNYFLASNTAKPNSNTTHGLRKHVSRLKILLASYW